MHPETESRADRPTAADRPVPPRLLGRRYRLTTVGVVLVVTVGALEAMSVATVMPVTVRDLHGLTLYAWAFTAFFLANVVGIVDAGRRADRGGPRGPLAGGLAVFGAGLLVAGTAPTMPVFVLGRALQGFGVGWTVVAIYVVVARVYDAELRPKVFSALSAAWVVPAVVGPAAAGAVASAVGWRWVFLGLAPVAAVGAALLVPTLRQVAGPPADAEAGPGVRRGTAWSGVRLAGGLAVAQAAGQRPSWWSVPLLGVAVALVLPPLIRLLPAGALRLRRGLPATVAYRVVLAGTFFTAEAFLPLTLVQVHGFGPAAAGLPLTFAAFGWSGAAWLQGRRRPDRPRAPLVRQGLLLVAAGVGTLALIASPHVWPWLSLGCWALAGAGMGLGMSTLSVLTMQLSPEAEQGANAAALQVCDILGSIVGIALAGTLLTLTRGGAGSIAGTVAVIDVGLASLAVLAAVFARRVGPQGSA